MSSTFLLQMAKLWQIEALDGQHIKTIRRFI
jgi:hypothetical protein